MTPLLKVERRMTNGRWYEVMLSPVKTEAEIQSYRVVNMKTGTILKELQP